ncbi:uncharacterized protein LOC107773183 [Nicotiana tabacum]|uniref:Uncharacterized protein LOC107773183 n=1 Tax=Nicotiana tabacum TaxID=4097 RepID=A0A1S3Y829_TOBAC|nr:PREDICTED: uncharacterized protein LOC107773183 [Nicotiana tabacum]
MADRGNFNAMLYTQDRMYGNPVTLNEITDFSNCIHNLLLNELPWKRDYYTWSNNQQGAERIVSRIDRIFGNDNWMMNWGHVHTEYDIPLISDHSPMFVNIKTVKLNIKTPFRFFNVWVSHDEFDTNVGTLWRRKEADDQMENIWKKLKALRPIFKSLNTAEYKGIAERIDNDRADLIQVQEEMRLRYSESLLLQEKTILQNLEKWSLIEENILKQKARVKWIKL